MQFEPDLSAQYDQWFDEWLLTRLRWSLILLAWIALAALALPVNSTASKPRSETNCTCTTAGPELRFALTH